MVYQEITFPRGGKIERKKPLGKKKSETQFGAICLAPKKKIRKNKKKEREDPVTNDTFEAKSAMLLSTKTIVEGLLIMGIVDSIDPTHLIVGLPGRIKGRVNITSISESYNKLLKSIVDGEQNNYKPLDKMFEVGDNVYVKVIKLTKTEGSFINVELSLRPDQLHSDLHHTKLVKGMFLCGAIEAIEDHGYTIDTGIKNVRSFLPIKKDVELSIGQLIYGRIKKITSTAATTTVIMALLDHKKMRKIEMQDEPLLDYLMPTGVVKFTVEKVLKDGLMGKIINDSYTAYVNELYLAHDKVPEDYIDGIEVDAKILYVMPLTKFVYLSLNFNKCEEKLQNGQIIENATILGSRSGGILLKIDNAKGFITFKEIKSLYKLNYDRDKVAQKYSPGSLLRVRIINYDAMDNLYICTDNNEALEEQFFAITDVKVGDFVVATVQNKVNDIGYTASVGKIRGFIYKTYLSKRTENLKIGSKMKTRIVHIDDQRKCLHLTNCPAYLSDKANLLMNIDDAHMSDVYLGTIFQTKSNLFVIRFFNDIRGVVMRDTDLSSKNYYESMVPGKIVHVKILQKSKDKLFLEFCNGTEINMKVGEIKQGKILESYSSGIEVEIDNKAKVWIPCNYISETPELSTILCPLMKELETTEVITLPMNVGSIRDVSALKIDKILPWEKINPGTVIRSFIKSINNNIAQIHVPIKNAKNLVKIHFKMMLLQPDANLEPNTLVEDQIVYVKVLYKYNPTRFLSCTALLTEVWNGDVNFSCTILDNYLIDLSKIFTAMRKGGVKIVQYKIGQEVKGIVKSTKVSESNEQTVIVELVNKKTNKPCQIFGQIKGRHLAKPLKEGDEVKCKVIWVDILADVLELTNNPKYMKIQSDEEPITDSKEPLQGEIIYKTKNFFMVLLKSNHIVYIPAKLHFNDFQSALNDRNGKCSVVLMNTQSKKLIAMFTDVYEDSIRVMANKQTANPIDYEATSSKREFHFDKETEIKSDIEVDVEKEASEVRVKKLKKNKKRTAQEKKINLLPISTSFWDMDFNFLKNNDTINNSNDKDDTGDEQNPKRQKLSAAERLEANKEAEARLRQIEENLANSTEEPQSVDQFDRLVLTSPHNSFNWIKYMVFYLQASEIEKARSVARRALKTIPIRQQHDVLNIWIALLNLELRFGTKEQFEEVFKEALDVNDQYKIYMRTIQILADAKKIQELSDLVFNATKKFRERVEMWPTLATAYFEVGLVEKAKLLMHKALAVLEERDHIQIICQFAKLNNKYGQKETAHALLEQILTSYPKRVDIWSIYVDMLVKDDRVDLARQILERAVSQKIPMKKMRTLFKKYLDFEEKYGDEKSIQKVKNMAAAYVKQEISN